jgi:hypothetical protein
MMFVKKTAKHLIFYDTLIFFECFKTFGLKRASVNRPKRTVLSDEMFKRIINEIKPKNQLLWMLYIRLKNCAFKYCFLLIPSLKKSAKYEPYAWSTLQVYNNLKITF